MNTSQTITLKTDDLAQLLSISKRCILNHRAHIYSPLLAGLPEPLVNRPACIWLRADIDAWLETKRTFRAPAQAPAQIAQPQQIVKRQRGRPRKSAVAAVSASRKGAA